MADRYTPAHLEQAGVEWVEIKCRTCPRAGRYRVQTLIDRYGRGCEDWIDQISADCPKRVDVGLVPCRDRGAGESIAGRQIQAG